ncbi:hypothetical protein Lal_00046040 [Lupinus albus]|nr:hypothetical protein Lal_00046040 [Lupinus albus]
MLLLLQERPHEEIIQEAQTRATIATNFQGNEVIIICNYSHVNLTSLDTCWFMGFGASFHNDNISKIMVEGYVLLETNTSYYLALKYVSHVLGICLNLMSMRSCSWHMSQSNIHEITRQRWLCKKF